MSEDAGGRSELDRLDLHDVLSNQRRQIALAHLHDVGGRASPAELADRVAVVETGEDPPPEEARQSAYVTLHQTHLPKLSDLGIVEYDQSDGVVALTDRAEQVRVFVETVPRYGISWSEFYLGVSALGLLLVLASQVGVPYLSTVPADVWGVAAVLVVGGSAAFQSIRQGSPVVERIRGSSR